MFALGGRIVIPQVENAYNQPPGKCSSSLAFFYRGLPYY